MSDLQLAYSDGAFNSSSWSITEYDQYGGDVWWEFIADGGVPGAQIGLPRKTWPRGHCHRDKVII